MNTCGTCEFFAAFLAGKFFGRSTFGGNSLVEAMGTSAHESAVLPVFTRKTGKRLLAVFTEFLNRHQLVPLFGNTGTLLMSIEEVK